MEDRPKPDDYASRLSKAKKQIENYLPKSKHDDHYETLVCEHCGENTVLYPDPTPSDGRVHCFNCGARFYTEVCEGCGGAILFQSPPDHDREPFFHEVCESNILHNF